ncbi:methionine adenosyltransferase 2 subunit beta isoform X2 [Varanus komodoensis]|uniref:methionine adenosyltransferase 2 subunit beta isoform X2 n=1 Tax=Varanus komodoensis TaxID=61221 RepID=UPI001CF7A637|nr:methionine adenosyltransferase 2 subunit beta isoform X2 [Varanus komodoensis]
MVGWEKGLRIHFQPGSCWLEQEDVDVPDRRVLITGATGLLGRAVYKEFKSNNWNAVGCGYSRARPLFEPVNLLDTAAVHNLIQDFQPHVIIHCAAERRPDVVDSRPEFASQLNVAASGNIAKEAGAAVLRIPVLYGEVESLEESAVTVMFDKVQCNNKSANMDHWQQRFPTYVKDVASVCRQLAEKRMLDPSIKGTFHWSGNEQMTKFEMARAMADAFNLPSSHLRPITDSPVVGALRPKNAQLDCSRLRMLGIGQHTPFQVGIKESLWPFLIDKRWRQTVFH